MGTEVNRAFLSLPGGSLENMLTVPLNIRLYFISLYTALASGSASTLDPSLSMVFILFYNLKLCVFFSYNCTILLYDGGAGGLGYSVFFLRQLR